MEIIDLTTKKLIAIERLSTIIKELSNTIFEADGNELVDVILDYNHDIKTVSHKKCRTNVNLTLQYKEDLNNNDDTCDRCGARFQQIGFCPNCDKLPWE